MRVNMIILINIRSIFGDNNKELLSKVINKKKDPNKKNKTMTRSKIKKLVFDRIEKDPNIEINGDKLYVNKYMYNDINNNEPLIIKKINREISDIVGIYEDIWVQLWMKHKSNHTSFKLIHGNDIYKCENGLLTQKITLF